MRDTTFNKYPYTDFHEMNLDWVIKTMQEYTAQFDGVLKEMRDAISKMDGFESDVDEKLVLMQRHIDDIRNVINNLIVEGDYDDTNKELTLRLMED